MEKGKLTEQLKVTRLRSKIMDMYVKGFQRQQIAGELGISVQAVGYHLIRVKQEWQRRYLQEYKHHFLEVLAKIDNLEKEYWNAYQQIISKGKQSLMKEISKNGKYSEQVTKSIEKDPGTGVEILKGIQWCIDKRIDLLGMKRPEMIVHLIKGSVDVNAENNEGTEAGRNDPIFDALVRLIDKGTAGQIEGLGSVTQSALPVVQGRPGSMDQELHRLERDESDQVSVVDSEETGSE